MEQSRLFDAEAVEARLESDRAKDAGEQDDFDHYEPGDD